MTRPVIATTAGRAGSEAEGRDEVLPVTVLPASPNYR